VKQAARIFLSHSSKDKTFVRKLAEDLISRGVPVWFDEWELKVGDSMNERIGQGIKESAWLAVVLSKNSVESKWVQKELNAALTTELQNKQVFVLPIIIDNCEIPVFLQDKVFADFRRDYDQGLASLLKRLIPEKVFFIPEKSGISVEVQRQPPRQRPEDSLPHIVDTTIIGKNKDYSGLFDVVFKLDKQIDNDWKVLFENPSTYPLNIHRAEVSGDEIHWSATEDHIKNMKHWVYDWFEEANRKYLPLVQQRVERQESQIRQHQQENAKIAELENILKSGREGTLIKPTNAVMIGLCSLRLDGCTAQNEPSPITQVNFEHQGYIHLCFSCLQKQIDNRKYRVE
jgi:hypothetical protein